MIMKTPQTIRYKEKICKTFPNSQKPKKKYKCEFCDKNIKVIRYGKKKNM